MSRKGLGKSHKFDSLVQAADINLLTLGKEAAIAINLNKDERRNKWIRRKIRNSDFAQQKG